MVVWKYLKGTKKLNPIGIPVVPGRLQGCEPNGFGQTYFLTEWFIELHFIANKKVYIYMEMRTEQGRLTINSAKLNKIQKIHEFILFVTILSVKLEPKAVVYRNMCFCFFL